MSVFGLVHGSTQNASGWARLVPELQNQGHLELPLRHCSHGAGPQDLVGRAVRTALRLTVVRLHSRIALLLMIAGAC